MRGAVMSQDPTRVRLLEAAGEEFAEKGYELARVRSICERAGANLAAVNYHFGDKERLYTEVLREAHRCGLDVEEPAVDLDLPPAEKLRAFIHRFLGRLLAVNHPEDWQHRLMLREMLFPTPFSEVLVRETIRPRFETMKRIMAEICPEADERRLNVLSFSVIGQCLHYKMARRVTERLIGVEGYQSLDHEYLTDHICSFSLAALGLGPSLDLAGVPSPERKNLVT